MCVCGGGGDYRLYCTVHCLFVHALTHTRWHTLKNTHALHSKIQVRFVVLNFIAFTYKSYRKSLCKTQSSPHMSTAALNVPGKHEKEKKMSVS